MHTFEIRTTVSRIGIALSLLAAMLAPVSAQPALFDISDVTITAFTSFSSQRVPKKTDFDERTAPPDQSFLAVNALIKEGLPFPNVPNSQNSGFASSAASIGGLFGVGVNGFHFENSLPPNDYSAAGTWKQSITNNSAFPVGTAIDFFIPAPTIRFFGVGDFFPPGRDPDLDATAAVELRLTTKLIHPNGSFVETVQFDYGMQAFRNPNSGAMEAVPSRDAVGELTRFDEFDGSFGFRLNVVVGHDPSYIDIGPGDRLEFGYDYLATAKTGFGETAVFAAIGDPFDLTLGGGGFHVQLGDISEPPSLVSFASLTAKAEISHPRSVHRRSGDSFEVEGHGVLGLGSNGIAPDAEDVTLTLGPVSLTIPAGSFAKKTGRDDDDDDKDRDRDKLVTPYRFKGVIAGVSLEAKIEQGPKGAFRFEFEGRHANFGLVVNPLTLRLAIGDDAGQVVIKADIDR